MEEEPMRLPLRRRPFQEILDQSGWALIAQVSGAGWIWLRPMLWESLKRDYSRPLTGQHGAMQTGPAVRREQAQSE
ncbi:hypothetical protein EJB05_11975 [Eragrostis curvula]|uniref:Uncharacterized protein n=1 Tax=Eragrostis curvula TaxID=38414 RepID=A0A5J9VQZ2_9POAL|nr:hypothetical protein EJB05_11975 [Eragrostis curvula]